MKIPALCLCELSSNEWRDQRAGPYAVHHGIVRFWRVNTAGGECAPYEACASPITSGFCIIEINAFICALKSARPHPTRKYPKHINGNDFPGERTAYPERRRDAPARRSCLPQGQLNLFWEEKMGGGLDRM